MLRRSNCATGCPCPYILSYKRYFDVKKAQRNLSMLQKSTLLFHAGLTEPRESFLTCRKVNTKESGVPACCQKVVTGKRKEAESRIIAGFSASKISFQLENEI